MYCILNIGMTGQGKSQFVKEFIKGRNCLVFDVQNEYNDLSSNYRDNRSRILDLDEKKFVAMVKQRIKTVCVFEEATGFFEGKLDKDVRRVVLSKRHTENVFIFCFHSISAVPPRLMQLTNFVVLFKTGDENYQVESKFPSLYKYFLQVKKLPKYKYLTIKTIQQ